MTLLFFSASQRSNKRPRPWTAKRTSRFPRPRRKHSTSTGNAVARKCDSCALNAWRSGWRRWRKIPGRFAMQRAVETLGWVQNCCAKMTSVCFVFLRCFFISVSYYNDKPTSTYLIKVIQYYPKRYIFFNFRFQTIFELCVFLKFASTFLPPPPECALCVRPLPSLLRSEIAFCNWQMRT